VCREQCSRRAIAQHSDLGSGAVMLLPDQPGDHPHLAVEAGKSVGRPHLADAVVRHPANKERLEREGLGERSKFLVAYLIEGAPAFVPRRGPSVAQAIATTSSGAERFSEVAGAVGHRLADGRLLAGVGQLVPVTEARLDRERDPVHRRHRLDRVFADGRLAGEHQGRRAVEDRVGHVARLGPRRLGLVDHRLEHLRRRDHWPAQTVA